MRSTLIPQNLPSTISPISVRSIQDNLAKAQVELSSGRWNDVGYKLAEQTGSVLNVRAQISLIDTFENTNSIVSARADVTQNALANIASETQIFFEAVIAGRNNQVSSEVVAKTAADGFGAVISSINSTINGVYVFSGINFDSPPLQDYFGTPQPASKSAVDAAFLAEFGFDQSDPAVAGITPAAMENFIDNAFSDLFDPTNWQNDWSDATDETLKTRIAFTQFSETSQSANESAIRKLAMAYTMVADLGIGSLNDSTRERMMEKAADLTGSVIGELNVLRGKVGVTQQRIEVATDKLAIQKNAFERLVGDQENVDPYEVATRISVLSNQLEASYTLTARLQQLSLVKFI
ncbi:hypothetical protein MNBD_ALPHA08-1576 [hydrothermal vent metagenome]|uniref:Flagellin n=1 Tax=hydrothermal vent metagenome TaxID=652676 RepID=A0A3B0RXI0_9ZZZZ